MFLTLLRFDVSETFRFYNCSPPLFLINRQGGFFYFCFPPNTSVHRQLSDFLSNGLEKRTAVYSVDFLFRFHFQWDFHNQPISLNLESKAANHENVSVHTRLLMREQKLQHSKGKM